MTEKTKAACTLHYGVQAAFFDYPNPSSRFFKARFVINFHTLCAHRMAKKSLFASFYAKI